MGFGGPSMPGQLDHGGGDTDSLPNFDELTKRMFTFRICNWLPRETNEIVTLLLTQGSKH